MQQPGAPGSRPGFWALTWDHCAHQSQSCRFRTLRYDAENQLIGVGSSISYVYNGQGQRVEKNLSGVKTDYLYDLASHVITAFQSAGT